MNISTSCRDATGLPLVFVSLGGTLVFTPEMVDTGHEGVRERWVAHALLSRSSCVLQSLPTHDEQFFAGRPRCYLCTLAVQRMAGLHDEHVEALFCTCVVWRVAVLLLPTCQ